MWNGRRIVKELADADRRRRICAAFWRYGDDAAKMLATAQLAKALRFREDSIRRMPVDKKGELLASRAASPEFEQAVDTALMHYHTHEQKELLGAFLDAWQIPHVDGSIEVDDYNAPTADQVREAVRSLDRFDQRDVLIYLAAAGLLMGDDWRAAMWPVVDELAGTLG